jgi:hypothetical protein
VRASPPHGNARRQAPIDVRKAAFRQLHPDLAHEAVDAEIIGRERRFEARVSGGSDDFQAHGACELSLPQIESDEISKTQLCGASDMKYIEGTAAQRWGVLSAEFAGALERRPPQEIRLDVTALREVVVQRR